MFDPLRINIFIVLFQQLICKSPTPKLSVRHTLKISNWPQMHHFLQTISFELNNISSIIIFQSIDAVSKVIHNTIYECGWQFPHTKRLEFGEKNY
jgi:hypothetical protein